VNPEIYNGVNIVEFADGDDAWADLSNHTPDLLITDYNNLGMRCEEMLHRLTEAKKACPIVLVSG
jgi:CheY-like chemotaxis protein